MQSIKLNGEWTLRQAGKRATVRAVIPGTVHTDLFAEGQIPDPYYRNNEDGLQWIGKVSRIYTRRFHLPGDFLRHEHIVLRCEGLDTLAAIKINSKEVARTDNMFRAYEFDIARFLKAGDNMIEIRFDSTLPYSRKKQQEHPIALQSGPHTISGGNWVRKEQCNYGWDWGPSLLTCGIWRPVSLVAWNTTRLDDVSIRQKHKAGGTVTLDISAALDGNNLPGVHTGVTMSRQGITAASGTARFRKGKTHMRLTIENPELWWLNGMDARFSDNFHHLRPGNPVKVTISPGTSVPIEEIATRIIVKSLKDTYK